MRRSRIIIRIVILLALIAALLYGVYYVLTNYRISPEKTYVEGNTHYTDREITDMVMSGPLGDNSLVLSFRFKDKKIEDVPFVDSVTVTILSRDSVRISVYEKALAGYVKYLDHYFYFDKDGYVVESSNLLTQGIPQVTGLDFSGVALGERLIEDNEDIFEKTLQLTKLMDKYVLSVDRIHFHGTGRVTLYFGDVRVDLGNEAAYLEDKVMRLPEILKHLTDKKGVLDMEEYNFEGIYIFSPDKD
ncbi:MAG: cell division protein FtsQ/DivIB [Lachnospiraceae bacterium]|nr:cell division protein FtsQ/DivIB [Lachnospiraceae bacterium]